jgi:hypothetical protein
MLKFAIKWNRYDIILKEIPTLAKQEQKKDKLSLFEVALLENKTEFVTLFVENQTNLCEFLKDDRLTLLYNDKTVNLN